MKQSRTAGLAIIASKLHSQSVRLHQHSALDSFVEDGAYH